MLYNDKQTVEQINDFELTNNSMPTINSKDNEIDQYYDQCIEYMMYNDTYAMINNTNNLDKTSRTYLDCFSAKSKHDDINISAKYNVPSFHIGSKFSATPMHYEDGYLDAVNYLRYGPNGFKMWLIIHPIHTGLLNLVLGQKINELREKNKKYKFLTSIMNKWIKNCVFPLHHERLLLTTKFLKSHNIKYKIIIQNPGEILYLSPGVCHQTIDNSVNCCEAVNVCSIMWNLATHMLHSCLCEDSSMVLILPTLKANDVITISRKYYKYECKLCNMEFRDKQTKKEHVDEMHKQEYTCDICNKGFSRKYGLTKHSNYRHNKKWKLKFKLKCKYCKEKVLKYLRKNHEKSCIPTNPDLLKKHSCKFCNKFIRYNNLFRHELTCKNKIKPRIN